MNQSTGLCTYPRGWRIPARLVKAPDVLCFDGARGETVSPQSEPPQPGQVMEKTYQAAKAM